MRQPNRRSFKVALLSLSLFCFTSNLPARDRLLRPIDDRNTIALPGNIHPVARPENDLGRVVAGHRMERMMLVLEPDNDQQAALDQLLADQQNPESASYHQWLTPEEFGRRFGVSEGDERQVMKWLVSKGFDVEPIAAGRRLIVFSGDAAQVEIAFHTEIHRFTWNGDTHHANATALSIPQALQPVVHGIVSLHDFRRAPQHRVEFTSGSSHYLAPSDFATIYDVKALYTASIDGTGQSIAVIGRTNIKLSDVTNFRSMFGLPANDPTVVLNGADPGIISSGEQMEAMLDVEWSGAVAPKASVKLIVSASTNSSDGIDLSAQYAVNQNLAAVITVSFGSCEEAMGTTENRFYNTLWQQAAAQGISVFVSSGDSGAAGCDYGSATRANYGAHINGLCSSPYSTCVGGTQFQDAANPSLYWTSLNGSGNGSALSYIPEAVWNESASGGLWAGGGGASSVYTKPAWQTGIGVPADGKRDVPDISLSAAGHDAYLVYMNNNLGAVGGTSASSPAFAGLAALVNQKVGSRAGNLNPPLYTLAAKQAAGGARIFHDIVTGNNSVPGATGFNAGTGYDLATGLGTVDAFVMVNRWADASTSTPDFQLSAPGTLPVTKSSTATLTVNIGATGGFSSAVALTATGLPAGVTASLAAATAQPGTSSTLTFTASAQATSGSTIVTITGTAGSLVHTSSVTLTVQEPCSYALNQAAVNLAAGAGTATVAVTAGAGCTWTASSNSSWLALASGASGSGNGTVGLSASANTATTPRTASVTVGGQSVAVVQSGASSFTLNPQTASIVATAGTGSVSVTSSSTTATWTATSNTTWITITRGASGTGSGTVNYSAEANSTTSSRTGTLTIAGSIFSLTQAAGACGFSINPTSARATSTAATYSAQVTTTTGCAWTATSATTWITVPAASASGKATGTVSYTVAANTAGASRTGSLSIAGQTLSVTQEVAPPPFALSASSVSVTGAASTGIVTVTAASASSTWKAVSGASWITITRNASGKGTADVTYSIAANPSTSPRTGTVVIAGFTFTVNQDGSTCSYSVTPASVRAAPAAANYSVKVTAPIGCAWTAASNAGWMVVPGTSAAGNGPGTVAYYVDINTVQATRAAALTIGGQTISITQEAALPPYSLSPPSASFTAAAGTGVLAVSAPSSTTSWTAVSNATWLTIKTNAKASGSKSVGYAVAANPSSTSRSAVIAVADKSVTVDQAGAACIFSVTPKTTSAKAIKTTLSAQVAGPSGCPWSAASNSDFVTVNSGASGNGNGTVSFTVAPNTGASRSGSLTVAGVALPVTQDAGAASFALNATTAAATSQASTGTVTVSSASTSAVWMAVSNVSWIAIVGGASGTGKGTVTYSVAANTGASRNGTMTIAGQTFTIQQAGSSCSYSLGQATISGQNGSFLFALPVITSSGCTWTASSSASWISLVSGGSGTGNGTATFSVQMNTTGAQRTGVLTVAGLSVALTESK